jgi:hypothetical protein
MSTTITTAAREYATRPADERHESVAALVAVAQHDRDHSREVNYNLRDLRAVNGDESVYLESPKGRASFSHWSFGQLARMVGAPAGYLREQLPAHLAADCLNHGISMAPSGTVASLLVQAPNGKPEPTIRACTSESYGRVWDAEIYSAVQDTIMANDPSWRCELVTRSDRDSYLTLTNRRAILQDPSVQAIVNDPNAAAGGIMYRSLTIGNSEVGDAVVVRLGSSVPPAACRDTACPGCHPGNSHLRQRVRAAIDRARQRDHSRFDLS